MRYAALWDRSPANHWEARLLANALMAGAMRLFGRTGWAAALPSLASSLVILGCVFYWCYRYADVRHAWWAGMLVAVLPMDVNGATTPSAYPLMTAFLTVGTLAFLESAESRKARLIAALSLSLGVVTHFAGAYYVASLMFVALLLDGRRYVRSAAITLLVGIVLMTADMAIFQFACGDLFGRFHIALMQASSENPLAPLQVEGRFNGAFLTWPVQQLIFSKNFGVSLSVALVGGIATYRRLPSSTRMLLIVSVVFWLWMSYGSQVPWAYKPFWRMVRFLAPLMLAVSILFGSILASARRRLLALIGGVAVLAICPFNLAASGSWGQSVQISRELLAWATSHPQTRFVTDFHTINEMYVLGGMQLPPNVVTLDNDKRSHLIDRDATRISVSKLQPSDCILDNPLNTRRTPSFAAFRQAHADTLQHQSQPTYRMICQVVPYLRHYEWSVRKPPARVLSCVVNDSP